MRRKHPSSYRQPQGSAPADGAGAHRGAGAHWEGVALAWLAARGLSLVVRNYRCRLGEIDLLMRDGEVLVVVEVRYRRTEAYGGAAASVGAGKRRRLALAARQYLSTMRGPAPPVRFDVVLVSGPPDTPSVRWLQHAFDAPP